MTSPCLVWFRLDLRLRDNPALSAALARGGPVIPCFVDDGEEQGKWREGGASRWWLHHSLLALNSSLNEKGSMLVLRRGAAEEELIQLVRETGAGAVYWNRRYEPAIIARDSRVKERLRAEGLEAKSFNAALLNEPQAIRNKQGGPFQVFTPYWRHCSALPIEPPVTLPAGPFPAPDRWPSGAALEALRLLPEKSWADAFGDRWTPGEAGAAARLARFLKEPVGRYAEQRDEPAAGAVSELSPHLHFGETSPRLIWAAAQRLSKGTGVFPSSRGLQKFLTEVGWREFAYHLLYHFPNTTHEPLREEFRRFPWADDPDGRLFNVWKRGRTGYPIVDAGMRELWTTGWMHNRVRMVAASFLVKHLRLAWQQGAAWFWDTLVDADLASNTLGWQWTAGCGADAAPYFRVFAPVLQGEKFDPEGRYVRRWIPELARLPDVWLHKPWEAPPEVLAQAGVVLGKDYPQPIVDHAKARAEALRAHETLRSTGAPGR
ncbi:MAG: deoxyribodipyrimidine photo-lyase [Opitutaceae bacterium]|nr:deoxyribodipyrimidine photo-lyase [Opitutaceae bacterium]